MSDIRSKPKFFLLFVSFHFMAKKSKFFVGRASPTRERGGEDGILVRTAVKTLGASFGAITTPAFSRPNRLLLIKTILC